MDIQKIKYNRELIKNKIRLEKELKMIDQEIKMQQEACDHIQIYFGKDYENRYICQCLLCRKKSNLSEIKGPYINGLEYKISIISTESMKVTFSDIQKMALEIGKKHQTLSKIELIDELNEKIQSSATNNHVKRLEKIIRRKY